MAKKSGGEFWEKYKHPKWQEMRLRVMEREEFTCQKCFSKTNTLNVHHSYYEKGKDPWEYPEESLYCWCDECHDVHHEWKKKIDSEMSKLSNDDLRVLFGAIKGLQMQEVPVSWHLIMHGLEARGIGMAFGVTQLSVEYAATWDQSGGLHIDGFDMLRVAGPYETQFRSGGRKAIEEEFDDTQSQAVASRYNQALHYGKVDMWMTAASSG